MTTIRLRNFITRLIHWEYWNRKVVYAPLIPYYLWLSYKGRSFYFLTNANPKIKNGGFIMESKKDIYDMLPAYVYPATLYCLPATPIDEVVSRIGSEELQYPLIIKPDYGERGLGVKKIWHESDLAEYCSRMPLPYLIQECITFPLEAGIFYCRYPGEANGFISGIVFKEFASVTGDGVHTLTELIYKNERLLLQWQYLKNVYAEKLATILQNGAQMILIPFGNHVRGCKFTDHGYRVSPELTKVIDDICLNMPDFYYGRLDIRFQSWDELEKGLHFSIIEVNGCGSEPTHIYDPRHSIFFAWKEILRHWRILFRITQLNKNKGIKSLTLSEGKKEEKEFKRIMALLSEQNL